MGKKNVLLIGSKGFVGGGVARELAERRDITLFPASRDEGLDLSEPGSITAALERIGPDVIINCAAHVGSVHYGMKYPATIIHENMMMILNLFRAAADACPGATMVNPISNCVYSMGAEIQDEREFWGGMPHPTALPYASTRRMIHVVAKSYHEQFGLQSKNLVLPGIYGPGDHVDTERVHALDGMVIRMIQSKRRGLSEFEVWGTGKPVREWCYIEDVAKLIADSLSLESELIEPVNLGQQQGHSIAELAEMIKAAVGFAGEIVYNTEYADGAKVKVLANERFADVFGSFAFTDIKTGIGNTVAYYESALAAEQPQADSPG